jgi:hypothetical protein
MLSSIDAVLMPRLFRDPTGIQLEVGTVDRPHPTDGSPEPLQRFPVHLADRGCPISGLVGEAEAALAIEKSRRPGEFFAINHPSIGRSHSAEA